MSTIKNEFLILENEFLILENIFNSRKWGLNSTLAPHSSEDESDIEETISEDKFQHNKRELDKSIPVITRPVNPVYEQSDGIEV